MRLLLQNNPDCRLLKNFEKDHANFPLNNINFTFCEQLNDFKICCFQLCFLCAVSWLSLILFLVKWEITVAIWLQLGTILFYTNLSRFIRWLYSQVIFSINLFNPHRFYWWLLGRFTTFFDFYDTTCFTWRLFWWCHSRFYGPLICWTTIIDNQFHVYGECSSLYIQTQWCWLE